MPQKTRKPKPRYDKWTWDQAISSSDGKRFVELTLDDRAFLLNHDGTNEVPGLAKVLDELEPLLYHFKLSLIPRLKVPTISEIAATLNDITTSAKDLSIKLENMDEMSATVLKYDHHSFGDNDGPPYHIEKNKLLRDGVLVDKLKQLAAKAAEEHEIASSHAQKGRPRDEVVMAIVGQVDLYFRLHEIDRSPKKGQPLCTFLENLFTILGRENVDVQHQITQARKAQRLGLYPARYLHSKS